MEYVQNFRACKLSLELKWEIVGGLFTSYLGENFTKKWA